VRCAASTRIAPISRIWRCIKDMRSLNLFARRHELAPRMSQTHAAHDKLSIVLMRALLPNRSN